MKISIKVMKCAGFLLFLLAVTLLLCTASGEASEAQQSIRELRERADNLYGIEDYRAALSLYERILAQDPGDAEAMDMSGWCHRRLGNLRSAEDMFERALKILEGAETAWILIGLGELHLDGGAFDAARSHFEEAIEVAPNNIEVTERAFRGIESASP